MQQSQNDSWTNSHNLEDQDLDLEEDPDREITVNPTKKCKKAYAKVTKSVVRGVQLGLKRGFRDIIDSMDFECIDTTSKAICYIINQ